jgi:hypothetical protein
MSNNDAHTATHVAEDARRVCARKDRTMTATAVLDVRGVQWATSAAVVESTLLRRPGVSAVSGQCAQPNCHRRLRPEPDLDRAVSAVGA